jgi:hypothetical protein
MQSLCTLRHHCRQWPRNTRYQAGATPYLGRTSTGWFTPACGWRTHPSHLNSLNMPRTGYCQAANRQPALAIKLGLISPMRPCAWRACRHITSREYSFRPLYRQNSQGARSPRSFLLCRLRSLIWLSICRLPGGWGSRSRLPSSPAQRGGRVMSAPGRTRPTWRQSALSSTDKLLRSPSGSALSRSVPY